MLAQPPGLWTPPQKLYVCVDFDGVVHRYTHYLGLDVFGDMVEGADKGMQYLHSRHVVIMNTTRPDTPAIRRWLSDHRCPFHYFNENPDRVATGQLDPRKPLADIYLDDKGVTFTGDWSAIIHVIENFKPWWKAA